MKNLIKTSVFLSICLVSVTLAHAGNDKGGGSGGDGLELSSAVPDGGVVTVPGDLADTGYLRVEGEAGAGQSAFAEVYWRCKTDGRGTPVRGQCVALPTGSRNLPLNQTVPIAAGTYRIMYSQTSQYAVHVQAGKTTVLSLRKISVPQTERPVTFKVFLDATDASMQERLAYEAYMGSMSENDDYIFGDEGVCEKLGIAPGNALPCNAWKSNDSRSLVGPVLRFDGEARVFTWQFYGNQFKEFGRWYVSDPHAGDFISVFGGVYGIEFTDDQTGDVRTQYGIKVD